MQNELTPSTPSSGPAELHSGHGRIVVSSHASKAVFSEMAATYPLKLLSPRIGLDRVAVVYILSYGGGLIGGDEVTLTVEVNDRARLVILSQGSTKVFKMRMGKRLATSMKKPRVPASAPPAAHPGGLASLSSPSPSKAISGGATTPLTTQFMGYSVDEGAGLFLLPEPVTCFRDASYKQIQRFYLKKTSSLVLLDSITSGRQACGEDWDFAKYYSLNEVWIEDKLVAKDVMALTGPDSQRHPRIPERRLRDQLAPYSCYAMVLLFGPQVLETIQDLEAQYSKEIVFQRKQPTDSVWSLSMLGDSPLDGAIVRVAGKETEVVRLSKSVCLRCEAEGEVRKWRFRGALPRVNVREPTTMDRLVTVQFKIVASQTPANQ